MKNKTIILLSSLLFFTFFTGFTRSETTESKVSVKTAAVKNITATSAQSGYTLTISGAVVTKHGICLSGKPGPTISNTIFGAEKSPGPSFNVNMTGLRPGVKNYIRAFATTKEGVTTYGNEVSFTTLSTKK
jgi:hypothetical protein